MFNVPLHNPPAAPASSHYLAGLATTPSKPVSAVSLSRHETRQLAALLLREMAADIKENPLDSPPGWVRDRLRFVEITRSGIASRNGSVMAQTDPLEEFEECLSRALNQLADSL